MALQQLSSGGASHPVTPVDATSQAAQQQNQSGFNLQQYDQDISGTPLPYIPTGAVTPQIYTPPTPSTPTVTSLTGAVAPSITTPAAPVSPDIQIDPFTQNVPGASADDLFIGEGTTAAQDALAAGAKNLGGDNPYPWDPFSFAGSGASEGAALPNEAASPGYQQFGQTWLDLLNTISTQNLRWGGTNQEEKELKGGGSTGPWLSQYVVAPWNAGNQQQAYAGALDFISSQTGKPPTDPETQQLAGAFLEYTLQNNQRYGANTQNFDTRKASSGGKGILGPLESIAETALSIWQPELAPYIALANLGQGAIEGNLTPFSAIGDIAGAIGGGLTDLGGDSFDLTNTLGITDTAAQVGPSLAGDASILSDLNTAGQAVNAVGDAAGVAGALAGGSPLGAIGPAVNLGGIANSFSSESPSGTTGSNATASGGITSGLANTLGINPQDFSQGLDDLMAAGSIGGAALPLVENLTSSSPTLNIQPQPAAPTPAATAAAAPAAPGAPGQALTPQQIYNASQTGYQAPGPRQANPTINPQLAAQILQALGVPA